MCGRYSLDAQLELLSSRYGIEIETIEFTPAQEIFPTTINPVVLKDHTLHMMKWGLTNPYSKQPIINSRLETVSEKTMFKKLIVETRCLIPATSFFEWAKPSKIKREITSNHQKIFSMAGIYRLFKTEDHQEVYEFSILTMPSNEDMESLHDRMPVILSPAYELVYLDEKTPLQEVLQVCQQANPSLQIQ